MLKEWLKTFKGLPGQELLSAASMNVLSQLVLPAMKSVDLQTVSLATALLALWIPKLRPSSLAHCRGLFVATAWAFKRCVQAIYEPCNAHWVKAIATGATAVLESLLWFLPELPHTQLLPPTDCVELTYTTGLLKDLLQLLNACEATPDSRWEGDPPQCSQDLQISVMKSMQLLLTMTNRATCRTWATTELRKEVRLSCC